MLIRKLKRGDSITINDTVIQVRKATDGNLTLAIDAPEGVDVFHTATDRDCAALTETKSPR